MSQGTEDLVEDFVQSNTNILGEKSQHVVTILLQQPVFLPVASIGIAVGEMLGSIEFDDQAVFLIEKINLDVAAPSKNNWKALVKPKPVSGGIESL